MIAFKPLELEDRDLLLRYLGDYNFRTYEYSFLTLYLWRKMYNTEISIVDDALIIKKSNKSTGTYFMEPIGFKENALSGIITKLKYIRETDSGYISLFRDVEEDFLGILKKKYGNSLVYHEDINNFDYIYEAEKLISLPGHKYHSKKNLYNQFVNNYNYEVRDIQDYKVQKDCMDFARVWYESKNDDSEQLKFELESIYDILPKAKLLNIKGMAVYVDDVIAGFAIGERVSNKMAIVHIEKGNLNYSGIYSFLNKTLVERYFSDVKLINRQEDLGIEGLRKAKMAYHPVRLEKKYIVDIL